VQNNAVVCQSGIITVRFEYELDIVGSITGNNATLTGSGNSLNYTQYQWYLGAVAINGANSISYTTANYGSYTLHATNSCNNASVSNIITFNGPNNQGSAVPQTIETCANSYTLNFVPAAGYTVAWYSCNAHAQNLSLLSSTTVYPNSTTVNETQYYVYKCTDNLSGSTCTSALITLKYDYVVNISSTNPTPNATLSQLTYSNLNTYSNYQWYKNNVAISGANSATYAATLPGVYYFTASTNNCGNLTSSTYTLTCGTNTYGSNYIFPPGSTPISNTTVIFDGNVTIPEGRVVNISSCTVIMQQNSSITVLNSNTNGVQGGQLIIDACNVSSCGDWQGIFVRGSSVAQSTDNGKLEIKGYSTIKNANIAVYGDNCARIHVEYSTFEDNYVHMQLNGFSNLNWNNTLGVNVDFDYCTFNALMASTPLSSLPNYVPAVVNNSYRPMVYLNDVKDIDFRHCDWNCTNYASTPDQIGLDVFDAIGTSVVNGFFVSGLFVENCHFAGEFNTAIYLNSFYVVKINTSTVAGDFYDGVAAHAGADLTMFTNNISHSLNGLGHTAFKMNQVLQGTQGSYIYGNTFMKCTNGMEYYYYSSNQSNNMSSIEHNTFQSNTYGLVFAPKCHPAGNVSCNNNYYSNYVGNITFECNKFISNGWGLEGVGDMPDQGALLGDEWSGFFSYYALNSNLNPPLYEYASTSTYADIAWYNPNAILYIYYHPQPTPNPNNGYAYTPAPVKFSANASLLLDNNTVNNANKGNYLYTHEAANPVTCWGSYKTDPNTQKGTANNSKGNIRENSQDTLVKIFPNPSAGVFNISNPSQSDFNYYIYNMMGQVMGSGYIAAEKTIALVLDNAANGCYTVILHPANNAGQRQTFRLIKSND